MDETLLFGNSYGNELALNMAKKQFAERRIIINVDISEDLLETVCLYILQFNLEDKDIPVDKRKPIVIILNSMGGVVNFGMGLVDCIANSVTPVHCVIIGIAASMASYIPMVCQKSYMTKNSAICIHDGTTGIIQTSRKANDTMSFYNDCDERLHALIIENTNITKDFLDEIADREYYIFAEKAKELGIVDGIIGEDCGFMDIL